MLGLFKDPEAYKKLMAERCEHLILTTYIIESGYAGVLSDGKIVDRRIYPKAIPVQENSLMGTPAPKPLP